MLIEPTETEPKAIIDEFIETMLYIAKEVEEGRGERFHNYPISTPRRRLDEVKAAKTPTTTWMQLQENANWRQNEEDIPSFILKLYYILSAITRYWRNAC